MKSFVLIFFSWNHLCTYPAIFLPTYLSSVSVVHVYLSIYDFSGTVGVCHGHLLSPCLCILFLEQIMSLTVENFEGILAVGCEKIDNLRIPYIDLIAGSADELADLTARLDRISWAFGMEISAEKSEIITKQNHGNNDPDCDIEIGEVSLQEVRFQI